MDTLTSNAVAFILWFTLTLKAPMCIDTNGIRMTIV